MSARPFVVHAVSIAPRRAIRTSTSERLGWVRALCDDETSLRIDLVELPPGERVAPEHAHSARDEAFFVLAGELTPIVEGAELDAIGPRALFVVPRGSATSTLRNTGDVAAMVLQISAALGDDVVRYAAEPGARHDRE